MEITISNISSSSTIGQLRSALQQYSRYANSPANLTNSRGITLLSSSSLSDCSITQGDLLKFTLGLRGGAPPSPLHASVDNTTVRVATLNLNGAPRSKQWSGAPSNLIWQLVIDHKIDILVLTDIRASKALMKIYAQNAAKYTNLDVRAITEDIQPLDNQHTESINMVGGCAIFAFGIRSHTIEKNTNIHDPSGACSFLGANLKTGPNKHICIVAAYLFPRSEGPTTVNKRIEKYLTETGIPEDNACQWQLDTLQDQLQDILDAEPSLGVILAGDFNERHWDLISRPKVAMCRALNLRNDSFTRYKNDKCFRTFGHHTANSTSAQEDSGTWIDHIVTKGPIFLQSACTDTLHPVQQITDHFPLIASFTIAISPSVSYNIHHDTNRRAVEAGRNTHILKHSPLLKDAFDNAMDQHSPPINDKTLEDFPSLKEYVAYQDGIMCELLQNAYESAQEAHQQVHPRNRTNIAIWSPDAQFLSNYYSFIVKAIARLTRAPPSQFLSHKLSIQNSYAKFLSKHQLATHKATGLPRYAEIIQKHLTNSHITSQFFEGDNRNQLLNKLCSERKRTRKSLASRSKKDLRKKISEQSRLREERCEQGKLTSVITSLLERPSQENPSPVLRPDLTTIIDPVEAHNAIVSHFSAEKAKKFIDLSLLNDEILGEDIRESLLLGTWRQHFPNLTDFFEGDTQKLYAATTFDNMKIKAQADVQEEIRRAVYKPITFQDFNAKIQQRKAKTAPGPSGVTASILQACKPEFLFEIFTVMSKCWAHKVPLPSWTSRLMALLPKNNDKAPTTDNLRPIMLLEICRKEWLGIIMDRVIPILVARNMFHSAQSGGLPKRGTEDAILQVKNVLEDSLTNAREAHILSFDKSKAFDTPGRWSGVYLAWVRIGLPREIARFIVACDEKNTVFPKTVHFLLHPSEADGFTNPLGISQGDPPSTPTFNVMADIELCTLDALSDKQDAYYFLSPTGILIKQPPKTFVDDLYGFHSNRRGAQTTINILGVTGTILNISLNGAKSKYVHYTYKLLSPTSEFYILDTSPTEPLTVTLPSGGTGSLSPMPPDSIIRVLGAFFPISGNDTEVRNNIHTRAAAVARTLKTKRASSKTKYKVITTAVYPSLGYIAKFTSSTTAQYQTMAGPLRKAIRQGSRLNNVSNEVLFAANSATYAAPFIDFADNINKDKESMCLRLLQSPDYQTRQTATTLVHRAVLQAGTDEIPSRYPVQCSIISPSFLTTEEQAVWNDHSLLNVSQQLEFLKHNETSYISTPNWAHSLAEHIQEGGHNLFIRNSGPRKARNINIPVTQSPIIDEYDRDCDNSDSLAGISRSHVSDFLHSTDLFYIEELFDNVFTPVEILWHKLSGLLPKEVRGFIHRIMHKFHSSTCLSLGVIVTRSSLMISTYSSENHSLASTSEVFRIDGIYQGDPNTEISVTALPFVWDSYNDILNRIPLIKVNRNKNKGRHTRLPQATQPQIILRFLHGVDIRGSDREDCNWIWSLPLRQTLVPADSSTPCPLQQVKFTHVDGFLGDYINWNFCSASNISHALSDRIAIYTDGSMISDTSLSTGLTDTKRLAQLSASIVISSHNNLHTPWNQREVLILKIHTVNDGPSTVFSEEALAAAVASALPTTRHKDIYTDCQSLVTMYQRLQEQNNLDDKDASSIFARNICDQGHAVSILVDNFHCTSLHHVKAHQQDTAGAPRTIHGTGNQIADIVAQGRPGWQNKVRSLVATAVIYETSASELVTPMGPAPILFGKRTASTAFPCERSPSSKYHMDPMKTLKLNALQRLHRYINTRPPSEHEPHIEWAHNTWDMAGSALSKLFKANPNMRTTGMRLLYRTQPNERFKAVINNIPAEDFPMCCMPGCTNHLDTVHHLFCECSSPAIADLRKQLFDNVNKVAKLEGDKLAPPQRGHLKALIQHTYTMTFSHPCNRVGFDSRKLAGLFSSAEIQAEIDGAHRTTNSVLLPAPGQTQASMRLMGLAIQQFVALAVPYADQCWQLYCTAAHKENDLLHPNRRPSSAPARPRREYNAISTVTGNMVTRPGFVGELPLINTRPKRKRTVTPQSNTLEDYAFSSNSSKAGAPTPASPQPSEPASPDPVSSPNKPLPPEDWSDSASWTSSQPAGEAPFTHVKRKHSAARLIRLRKKNATAPTADPVTYARLSSTRRRALTIKPKRKLSASAFDALSDDDPYDPPPDIILPFPASTQRKRKRSQPTVSLNTATLDNYLNITSSRASKQTSAPRVINHSGTTNPTASKQSGAQTQPASPETDFFADYKQERIRNAIVPFDRVPRTKYKVDTANPVYLDQLLGPGYDLDFDDPPPEINEQTAHHAVSANISINISIKRPTQALHSMPRETKSMPATQRQQTLNTAIPAKKPNRAQPCPIDLISPTRSSARLRSKASSSSSSCSQLIDLSSPCKTSKRLTNNSYSNQAMITEADNEAVIYISGPNIDAEPDTNSHSRGIISTNRIMEYEISRSLDPDEILTNHLVFLGLRKWSVRGDGNCFYYSLQFLLQQHFGLQYSVNYLRQTLVEYLLTDPSGQDLLRTHHCHESLSAKDLIQQSLPHVQPPGINTWARRATAAAAAHYFDIRIRVLQILSPTDMDPYLHITDYFNSNDTNVAVTSTNFFASRPNLLQDLRAPATTGGKMTLCLAFISGCHYEPLVPLSWTTPRHLGPILTSVQISKLCTIDNRYLKNKRVTKLTISAKDTTPCDCPLNITRGSCLPGSLPAHNRNICHRRFLAPGFCPSSCHPTCGNKEQFFREQQMYICKSLHYNGYTAFAATVHMKGEIVAIYYGEVYNQQQYDKLPPTSDKSYFARAGEKYGNYYYIDARLHGGHARFIDHSCNPNCELTTFIREDGSLMLVLLADRTIGIFDQYSFNYNWVLEEGEQNPQCFCSLTPSHGIKRAPLPARSNKRRLQDLTHPPALLQPSDQALKTRRSTNDVKTISRTQASPTKDFPTRVTPMPPSPLQATPIGSKRKLDATIPVAGPEHTSDQGPHDGRNSPGKHPRLDPFRARSKDQASDEKPP